VSAELAAEIGDRPGRRAVAVALRGLRPQQWTKNLLLFAGLVFAAKLGDGGRWGEAAAAFGVYCATSSAAYLVNDVRDRASDRNHPLKRARPVASGDLSVASALALAGVLAGAGLSAAAVLGTGSLALVCSFVLLQLSYTLVLKHVALVDVLAIAGLFVIRAAAGAVAVDVRISPWLLVCTGLLALFLALGKRRGELVLVASRETPGRRVLTTYSLPVLDRLVTAVAALTVAVYAAYTISAHDSPALPLTIPFVAFGLCRYVYLVRRRGVGEEPDQVLVSDKPILAAVAVWVVVCAIVLTSG
jgi:4-hydroxybenzoate polyprenyltransferase